MKHLRLCALLALTVAAVASGPPSSTAAEIGLLPAGVNFSLAGKGVLLEAEMMRFECRKSSGHGTVSSDTELNIVLDLEECSLGIVFGQINSLGDAKGVILINRTAKVCLLDEKTLTFALAIPMGEAGLHIEAPAIKALYFVKGTLFGKILGTEGNTFTLDINGNNGKQEIVACAGGKEEPLVVELDSNGAKAGLSALFAEAKLTFEKSLLLMDN